MKRHMHALGCLIFLLFINCSDSGKTKQNMSSVSNLRVSADTNTYFPLIAGSVWHYEEYLEGEYQPGNGYVDSVANTISTDSGTICKVIRITDSNKPVQITYIVGQTGLVYLLDDNTGRTEYCRLQPQPSDTVGNQIYSSFLDVERRRIRLETSDYENSSYDEQMEWQGTVFEVGIGVISFGGSSIGMELIEYRIGISGDRIVRRSI